MVVVVHILTPLATRHVAAGPQDVFLAAGLHWVVGGTACVPPVLLIVRHPADAASVFPQAGLVQHVGHAADHGVGTVHVLFEEEGHLPEQSR